MGFWETVLQRVPYPVSVFTPNVTELTGRDDIDAYYRGASPGVSFGSGFGGSDLLDFSTLTPALLWRSQPHLRTVVSFLARNIAQLGVHSFERVSETDRRRDRTSPAARALADPDVNMSTYELMYSLVGDLALYDRAFWYVAPTLDTRSGWMLRRIPPAWVDPVRKDPWTVKSYRVSWGGSHVDVPPENVLVFTGYAPDSPYAGSPTVETLKEVLAEQIESARYRRQIWKRGGRVSAVLQRPTEAPKWSDAAREKFREDWYAKYTGSGQGAGGTPILEDGMTLQRIDFSASDQQYVEAAKLSLVTVAASFHVNPTMVGQNDGANYSNVREFRRMLYGDTLGPTIAQIESRLNAFLLPKLGVDPSRFYVEFNIAEKLQGSFEEQSAALSSSTGRPWMTANEARARQNLPALDGDADQLVTPLNVLTGGQASPRDSGSQNRNAGPSPRVKARAPQRQHEELAGTIGKHFRRQEQSVRSRLGVKSSDTDWWDQERWDDELTDDLYRMAVVISGTVAAKTLRGIGFSPDEFDADRTLEWLREVSARSASAINSATAAKIEAALTADDPASALDAVFLGQTARADQIATSTITTISGFATTEAARQVAGDAATKTWVSGANARPSHAAMDGETVALSENFSNGAAWPGDGANLGADDLAGCNCALTINT